MKIAFFDFDGTLIKKDSFILFCLYSLKKSKIFVAVCKIFHELLLAKMGFINRDKTKEKLFRYLFRGMDINEFNKKCEDFVAVLEKYVNENVSVLIDEFHKGQIRTVIVSASILNWLEPFARKHGFDGVIATEIDVSYDGKITGFFKTPNCVRQEKVNRIIQMFPDIDKYEIYAIGDSRGDKEMLALANHPFNVNTFEK